MTLWEVADGLMTDAGVTVYSTGCIGERNSTYEVAQYAPGFLLIGDNGGGRGFLLRTDDSGSAVFSSDLGDLAPEDLEVESADFASWIESLRPTTAPPNPALMDQIVRDHLRGLFSDSFVNCRACEGCPRIRSWTQCTAVSPSS